MVAKIVDNIIDQRVEGGQFNECDLTLRDLAIVRDVFVSALKGTFHPRIQYPSEEEEQEDQDGRAGTGQDSDEVKVPSVNDGREV
jgi:hypothetical protein